KKFGRANAWSRTAENSGDAVLLRAENNTLECGLTKREILQQTGGYWKATVEGKLPHIVSVDLTNGRAIIKPPRNSTVYDQLGEVQIVCQYYSKDNKLLYQFVRRVTVLDHPEDYSVIFEPSNGDITVGGQTKFKCIRQTDLIGNPTVNYRLTDLNNRTDLIWVSDGKTYGSIWPPKGKKKYEKLGSTVVRCEYMRFGDVKATAELLVDILREFNRTNIYHIQISQNSSCFGSGASIQLTHSTN
ncbi:hypothetical protein FBUS_10225, partial [Fasciolopsis buskii]